MNPWLDFHLRLGLHVFPVSAVNKTPLVKWSQAATDSPDTAALYWRHWPDANIGIACRPSSIVVVDMDLPKTGRELDGSRFQGLTDGLDVYAAVCHEAGHPIPYDTYTTVTRSGGCQQYWRVPAGAPIGNCKLAPMVDIRGVGNTPSCEHGGYVLGAGSRIGDRSYSIDWNAPIQPMPPWLLDLLTALNRHEDKTRETRTAVRSLLADPRGKGSIEGLVSKVANAPDGNANNALHWAACRMALEGRPLDEAVDRLVPAYVGRGGDVQARATIRSAYQRHGSS